MKSEPVLARIVPTLRDDGDVRATLCHGTKVMVGDQQLGGVVRIELVAEVNNVWRARVDLTVQPPADLQAMAVIHYPSLWQRIRRWVRIAFGPAHGFDFPR